MIKRELVKKVAKKAGATQSNTAKVVDALCEVINEQLINGEKVMLNGFGNFQLCHRAARKGRNPSTGEVMHVPATQVVVFKPGYKLADSVASMYAAGIDDSESKQA